LLPVMTLIRLPAAAFRLAVGGGIADGCRTMRTAQKQERGQMKCQNFKSITIHCPQSHNFNTEREVLCVIPRMTCYPKIGLTSQLAGGISGRRHCH
jgi:hypothetical protein